MPADIQPADVYQRVEETRLMVGWLFGIVVVLLVASVVVNLMFFTQKRALVAQIGGLVEEFRAAVLRFQEALKRIELWLSLVELHYQRGAEAKSEQMDEMKRIREYLMRASKEGKLPADVVAELKGVILSGVQKVESGVQKVEVKMDEMPDKTADRVIERATDPASGLPSFKQPGAGDSHHG